MVQLFYFAHELYLVSTLTEKDRGASNGTPSHFIIEKVNKLEIYRFIM